MLEPRAASGFEAVFVGTSHEAGRSGIVVGFTTMRATRPEPSTQTWMTCEPTTACVASRALAAARLAREQIADRHGERVVAHFGAGD
ncbi:MAG TPA: hypothetical protein VIF62_30420, partial [Labilithrix sp.]